MAGSDEALNDVSAKAEESALRYPDNAIDAFRHGRVLDLRVRFAMELLTHSPMFNGLSAVRPPLVAAFPASGDDFGAMTNGTIQVTRVEDMPQVEDKRAEFAARLALDVATELFALAEARGLTEALDSPGAEARLKAHVKRSVTFQLEQGREQQRQAEDAARLPQAVRQAFTKQ